MVIFKKYNNISEALVVFSALEAAEFHPSWHNYHHAHIAYMQMLAFGGLIILLPASEVQDAKAWLAYLGENPVQDGDDLPRRKYGMWKHALSIAAYNSPAIFIVPFLWLKPWVSLIVLGLMVMGVASLFGVQNIDYTSLFFYLIAAVVSGVLGIFACLLWPLLLLALWLMLLGAMVVLGSTFEEFFVGVMWIIPIGILLHAKYIAVPKLEKRRPHVT